jgi:hypothetical protein
MAIINGDIPSLINGISQQPDSLRNKTQAELQENCVSSIVDGLGKRSPTEHIAKLRASLTEKPFIHFIDRGAGSQYVLLIHTNDTATSGTAEIFDLSDGTSKTINFNGLADYFDSTDPRSDFRAITINDYTFIVNTTVVCDMDSTSVPTGTFKGSKQLFTDLPASPVDQDVWKIEGDANTSADNYYVRWESADSIWREVPAPDGLNSKTFTTDYTTGIFTSAGHGYKENHPITVSSTTTLPAGLTAATRYFVKVIDIDTYTVSLTPNGTDVVMTDNGTGTHSSVDLEQVTFDKSTMPHMLVPNTDGSFELAQPQWNDRGTGDINQNGLPSMINRTINGMFLFRNRYGFLTADKVVMSQAGDFFNFWPDSSAQAVATDPIDVTVLHDKPSTLRRAKAFDETMLLFTDQAQFVVNADGPLSQSTISVDITTSFETETGVDPVASGQNVYFPVERQDYSAIREYFVEADTVVNDAADITGHVPRYIPKDLFAMEVSSNEDLLFVTSNEDTVSQYVYKYFWEGDEKKQSSWSKWTYDSANEILGFGIIKSLLYIVFLRSDGIHLEKMELSPTADTGIDYKARLDHRLELTGVYVGGATNETTWTIPYTWTTGLTDMQVLKGNAFGVQAGELITVKSRTTTTIVAEGDHSTGDCIIGVPYTARYTLSEQFVRDKDGTIQGGGRLQMKHMEVRYADTGYFACEVTPNKRTQRTYKFTGKILGDSWVLGEPNVASGVFRFPIFTKSEDTTIDFVNDTVIPHFLQSVTWEGRFVRRSRGV